MRRELALGLLALVAFPARGGERQLRTSVELGYDSFLQRFHLSDELLGSDLDDPNALDAVSVRDTTEVFEEFRSLAELEWVDEREGGRINLRARASLGSESNRQAAALEARMGQNGDPTRLDLSALLDARQFRDGGDYELQSDAVEVGARLHLRRQLSEEWQWGLRLRGANESYESQSEYEQDQRRLDVSATAEFERGLNWFHALEFGAGWRELPDTSQISSQRLFALQDLQWWGSTWFVTLHAGAEWRDFRDDEVRSAYWDVLAEPRVGRSLGLDWRLSLRSLFELLAYDRDTSVYFDSSMGQVGTELSWQRREWSLSFEPRWSWLAAAEGIEDRFQQPSFVTHFEWFGGGRLWLSLEEEVGRRDYAGSADDFDFYTDYWFLRSTALLSLRLNRWLHCDAFVSDEPESHHEPVDDGRLSLFSISLRATF